VTDPALASLADFANMVGVDPNTLNAGSVNFALAVASDAVRSYCNWPISYRSADAVQLNGYGMPKLFLPTRLLLTVRSVQLDFTPLQPVVWDGTTAGQYGYQVNRGGWLTRAPMWIWPEGEQRITVVFDHGYWTDTMDGSAPAGVPTIPMNVVGVTCSVAARMLDNPESVRSRRVGEEAEMYDGAALTAIQLSPGDMAALKSVYHAPGPY